MFLLTWLDHSSARSLVPWLLKWYGRKVLRAKNGYDLLRDFR